MRKKKTPPAADPAAGGRPAGERLHKIIARAGLMSLRAAERAIAEGRVKVNGRTLAAKGATADPLHDKITVNGKPLQVIQERVYLLMNKPRGVVTTRADEEGRKTVMDLLPNRYRHVFPVGRLDLQSEGLLILTNDGAFAQFLLSPQGGVERVYHVKVRNKPAAATLQKIISGVTVEKETLKAESARVLETTKTNAWLEITLTAGKNRHIRRMLEPLGHPVVKLKRVSIGPLKLMDLKSGETRHLPVETVGRMMRAKRKEAP
ncbi:MAG: rRNA pseudouridine synthase [Nitrospinae bacterium]|nr:rRNA pseudouridine synthase [Nitrospinota bacterium]